MMRFNEIHSLNVQLDESRTVARRIGSSFCDSFIFSEFSLKLNSYISIKFLSCDNDWKGQAFIGLTTQNPSIFIENAYSKYLINLLDAEDVWIRSIKEQWKNSNLILHLTFDGSLEVTCEHESSCKYVLFQNLPVNIPLWFVFELYGSTQQIELPIYRTNNSREIVSLCMDANAAFRSGKKGIVPYSRSRVIIIGPPKSGKNKLKSALFKGENLDKQKTQTAHSIETEGNGQWRTRLSETPTKQKMNEINKSDEYQHIAYNLIHEIKEQNRETNQSENSLDLIKNFIKLSRILPKSRNQYSKEVKQQLCENQIPDELLKIIQDILSKNITNNDLDVVSTVKHKHLIDICSFRGNLLYSLINQFFFTNESLFLFVFDLSKDFNQKIPRLEDYSIGELYDNSVSYLDVLHYWLALIHTSIASFPSPIDEESGDNSIENSVFRIKPQIMLVGTHKSSIKSTQKIQDLFQQIFNEFESTVYGCHLCKKYYAIELDSSDGDNLQEIIGLRTMIDDFFQNDFNFIIKIPLAWIQLGSILDKFKQRGIFFVDINQLHEVVSSQNELYQSYDCLNAALNFLHNQSRIFYLDCVGYQANSYNDRIISSYELGIIILDPQWFMNCIYDLCNHLSSLSYDDDNAQFGVIQESVINIAWNACIDQKFILLGCLESLDIICELSPYIQLEDGLDVASSASTTVKLYFFPWISKWDPNNPNNHDNSNNQQNGVAASSLISETSQASNIFENDLNFIFYINFNLLPLSLFTRLMVRVSKWSWSQGWSRKPEMYQGKCRVAVDFDHDVIFRINLQQHRICVTVIKIFEELHNDNMENYFVGPGANVCVKVHHMVESELESLKNIYYRRLSFKLAVRCPCDVQCSEHHVDACSEESCLHFLSLHDCLHKRVVECEFNRQIRTAFVQRFLPFASNAVNSRLLSYDERFIKEDVLFETLYNPSSGDPWDNIFQVEPLWMREAAKLLNSNQFTNDWIALAKRLSYNEREISKFSEEISPSLALLKNWYETNNRTRYCIDVLISCLVMLAREDIASLIEYELEPESSSPPIFLSYQHDSHDQVLEIRRKLELSGYPCWMDTSFITGGESLYAKIYEGLSRAKVFICCLTPRFVSSIICHREVSLADMLHKPVIPLMIEFTPWPPPGPMALILSSTVYVDMCGVGSHSGIGRIQDTESKFREILDKVSRYISGYNDSPIVPSRYLQLPELFNPRKLDQSLFTRRALSDGNSQNAGQYPNGIQNPDNHSIKSETIHSLSSPTIDSEADDLNNPSSPNSTVFDMGRAMNSNDNNQSNNNNNNQQISERLRYRQQNGGGSSSDVEFTTHIVADDQLSVLSRTPIANRITNCTVCCVM